MTSKSQTITVTFFVVVFAAGKSRWINMTEKGLFDSNGDKQRPALKTGR